MSEKEKLYQEILEILDEVSEDTTIPRNIRRSLSHARDTLADESKSLDMRVASAIFELDEIANDPNIPVHGRTVVYMAMGKLETLSKMIQS